MGMAASQARFLGLTARKTNVEYEGQQVNQQRTTLSNQTASYYTDLLGMTVPVPPSIEDYTKTVYSFQDGALNNTINSMIAQKNGLYTISYTSSWQDDFSPVASLSHVVTKVGDDEEGQKLYDAFTLGTAGGCYSHLKDHSEDSDLKYQLAHIPHVVNHMLGVGIYKTSDGKTLTIGSNPNQPQIYDTYWIKPTGNGYQGDAEIMSEIAENIKGKPIQQKLVDLLYNARQLHDGPVENITQEALDDLRNQLDYIVEQDLRKALDATYMVGKDTLRDLSFMNVSIDVYGNVTGYYGNDEYLKTLSNSQLTQTIAQEKQYIKLLNEKYGESDWMIRYVKNTTTGNWEPEFYNKDTIKSAVYSDHNDANLTSLRCYRIGSDQKKEEIKNVSARLEQDTTGRIIAVTLRPGSADEVTYAVTTNTVADQAKYDDAMNQYEYEKAQYDQAIQETNAKIEVIQAQDKNLELRLKQLDTEQEAIQTEMDAVSKVLEKNTESSFKTFG